MKKTEKLTIENVMDVTSEIERDHDVIICFTYNPDINHYVFNVRMDNSCSEKYIPVTEIVNWDISNLREFLEEIMHELSKEGEPNE